MFLIAAIHLLWLLLAPLGIAILSYGMLWRKRWPCTIGVVAVVVSLLALYFCNYVWPFDFLLPMKAVRLPVTVDTYQVTLVHFPDDDLYTTGFEVRRADGKIARCLISGDDTKWWNPHVVMDSGRAYFVRDGGTPISNAPYIDLSDGSIGPDSTFDGRPFKVKLDDLDFFPEPRP